MTQQCNRRESICMLTYLRSWPVPFTLKQCIKSIFLNKTVFFIYFFILHPSPTPADLIFGMGHYRGNYCRSRLAPSFEKTPSAAENGIPPDASFFVVFFAPFSLPLCCPDTFVLDLKFHQKLMYGCESLLFSLHFVAALHSTSFLLMRAGYYGNSLWWAIGAVKTFPVGLNPTRSSGLHLQPKFEICSMKLDVKVGLDLLYFVYLDFSLHMLIQRK